MFLLSDKNILIEQLIVIFNKKLETLINAANIAKEAATNEESKAENKYDTRGLEASYLAGAQAKMALDLKEQLAKLKKVKIRTLDSIEISSIFSIIDLNETISSPSSDLGLKNFILLPVGGGEQLTYKNSFIRVISLDAPLANLLYKKKLGDIVEFKSGNKFREYEVRFII